ncbi:hypothetical protein HanXRQr2_Chr09g0413481 [Helianthus annuus]|uniref:Uncharacterized protein n=1 Tax=Helianthus annuus TaxID=4232 RepID=A0A251TZZ3_HELAN|nr:hypothetical protein HanXRQr2_Chr09g0413481 [Helianthus annuus]KAJ0544388.1 hypothetical protein HanHA89_Chr09g0361131 [Helianthus annuus]KAJ0709389.1 hypothetical protein HanLR1_Chr09g0339841 [Helianthus annuus]KAJ0713267.1 hypothetical protein HanOQP8_Chr09g0343991 [Helianthus annuus]KAJ0895354.1 hypothetical protein HanPSC8_Chr09g0399581 [Helianthus annuus]
MHGLSLLCCYFRGCLFWLEPHAKGALSCSSFHRINCQTETKVMICSSMQILILYV